MLHVDNPINKYGGNCSITNSNSSDDRLDDLDYNIYFNLTIDFEGINVAYDFISQSSTKIEFLYSSISNGVTDYLI